MSIGKINGRKDREKRLCLKEGGGRTLSTCRMSRYEDHALQKQDSEGGFSLVSIGGGRKLRALLLKKKGNPSKTKLRASRSNSRAKERKTTKKSVVEIDVVSRALLKLTGAPRQRKGDLQQTKRMSKESRNLAWSTDADRAQNDRHRRGRDRRKAEASIFQAGSRAVAS